MIVCSLTYPGEKIPCYGITTLRNSEQPSSNRQVSILASKEHNTSSNEWAHPHHTLLAKMQTKRRRANLYYSSPNFATVGRAGKKLWKSVHTICTREIRAAELGTLALRLMKAKYMAITTVIKYNWFQTCVGSPQYCRTRQPF